MQNTVPPEGVSDPVYYSSPMAYLVLTDSSQLTSDSQHLDGTSRPPSSVAECRRIVAALILAPSVCHALQAQYVDKGVYLGVVYIQVGGFSTEQGVRGCTGSIISPKWVLLASYCLGRRPNETDPRSVWVLSGVQDRRLMTSGQLRRGQSIQVHPDRSGGIGGHNPYPDLALLEVDPPFKWGKAVDHITILSSAIPYEDDDADCWVVGWWFNRYPNRTESHGYLMRRTPVTLVSYTTCREFTLVEHESQMCVRLDYEPQYISYNGNPVFCGKDVVGIQHARSPYEDKGRRVHVFKKLVLFYPWIESVGSTDLSLDILVDKEKMARSHQEAAVIRPGIQGAEAIATTLLPYLGLLATCCALDCLHPQIFLFI
uniref:Peptidase S1 domain-containing protein n=1 Tax=Timema poppense TaxID=170557 RepID=A0A7R9H9G7_TIMPO|nr:unnamed protein product [Timema poppensis]